MDMQIKETQNREIPAVCRSCEARHGGICSALTSAQLAELSKHSSRRKVEAGNEVIGQGESITSYSSILNGVVKLSKVMADGRQQIVGLQFAPDFLGRPFLGESRMSAEAAVDTEICARPRRKRLRASCGLSPTTAIRKRATRASSSFPSPAPTLQTSSG